MVDPDSSMKSGFWRFGSVILSTILQIGFTSIVARLVKPEDYGVAALFIAAFGIIGLIADFGMSTSFILIRKVSRFKMETYRLASVLVYGAMALISSVLISAWFIDRKGYIEVSQDLPLILLTAMALCVKGWSMVDESLNIKNMKFKKIALIDIGSLIFSFGIIGISLAFYSKNYLAVFLPLLVHQITRGLLFTFLGKQYRSTSWARLKYISAVFKKSYGFAINNIAGNAIDIAPVFIIQWLFGIKTLGYYNRINQLYVSPAKTLGSSIAYVLFPKFANRSLIDQKTMYLKLVGIAVPAFSAISCILALNGDLLVDILLGPKWQEIVMPLSILFYGLIFRIFFRINETIIKSNGDWVKRSAYQALFGVTSIVMLIAFKGWNLMGIAIALTLSAVLYHAALQIEVNRFLGISLKSYTGALLKSLMVIVFVHLLYILVDLTGFETIGKSLLFFAVISAGSLFFLFQVRKGPRAV
ncbi:oligosaccharide flippase family protein [Deinococcus cellulosilyticus]|uniref:oligosaccharide flippase family protein n=1 Tax=Deinococcus cellulosilyticus TaxID=401558 RepID=UPI0011BEF426|nr:oligosaccharide flippase family protein [Deinococcus cellulosilyticus]